MVEGTIAASTVSSVALALDYTLTLTPNPTAQGALELDDHAADPAAKQGLVAYVLPAFEVKHPTIVGAGAGAGAGGVSMGKEKAGQPLSYLAQQKAKGPSTVRSGYTCNMCFRRQH